MVRHGGAEPDDAQLLDLFRSDPERAWGLLLDRYGARLVGFLRALGYDRDQAMDRFVDLCDRLRDQGFRRLQELSRVGTGGELVPWLLTVAKRVAIDRTIAELGRRRLPRSIETLDAQDQRVFALYFWSGLRPSELCEHLSRERNREIDPLEIFDALERILERLKSPRIWRLIAQRGRQERPAPLDDGDTALLAGGEEGMTPSMDPERALIERQKADAIRSLLDRLPEQERTVLRLRYGEGLGIRDLAAQLGLEPEEAARALRRARRAAKRRLEPHIDDLAVSEVMYEP